MGDIKLSRNELLQQARKVSNIKDEIDKILRETTNTYNVLNRVSEVSTWSARRELDNVRSAANKASRDLGSLCTSINSAIRIYDQKEKELDKLAEIKKKNLASNSIRKDQQVVSSYPIGKNITFKTNNTRALGNLNKTKSILKADVNKVGNMVGVATAVSVNAVSNIIAVKGNELGGLIGRALSKLSNFDIKNITGIKTLKNNVIKPLLKVATVPINLLGNVVKASNKIFKWLQRFCSRGF